MTFTRRTAPAAIVLALCLIYLPDIGHGFIRDDFMWIRVGRIASAADIPRLLTTSVGFYRPIVLASFGANYALFGLNAFPYAVTNFALLLLCAWLVARLARALGLSPLAGWSAAAVWTLNFHAVGMSLLWLSGRTALLLSLFALLTMTAVLRKRWGAAALWCLLALLSKEEAVVLPFLAIAWTWWSSDRTRAAAVRSARDGWPLLAALAAYAILRHNTAAFGPLTAPSYYQLTFLPAAVLRNALEYLDRSTTPAAAVALVVWVASWRRIALVPLEHRAIVFAVWWLVAGFAITVFLPLRSDLYALAPSIGPSIACGVIIQALERQARTAVGRVLAALAVLPLALLPIYRERNVRWVMPADVSRQILAQLARDARTLPDGSRVRLIDSAAEPVTLDSAFGTLMPDAGALFFGDRLMMNIESESDQGNPPPTAVYRLHNGRLERAGTAARRPD